MSNGHNYNVLVTAVPGDGFAYPTHDDDYEPLGMVFKFPMTLYSVEVDQDAIMEHITSEVNKFNCVIQNVVFERCV